MKFDIAIGNPPYHYEAGRRKIPIYNHFIMELTSDHPISDKVCLITPDGFVKGGQQLEPCRNQMIESKHLQAVEFHQDNLFHNAEVNAAITLFDNDHQFDEIKKTIVYEDCHQETGILDWYYRDVIIDELKYRVLKLFETKVVCENNMSKLVPGRSPCGDGFSSKCFNENKAKFKIERERPEQHKVLVNADKEYYYIDFKDDFSFKNDDGNIVNVQFNLKNIDKYKMSFAKAGSMRNIPLTTRILEPGDIFIDKFLCIYADSLEIAKNIEKYFNSNIRVQRLR